MKPINIGFNNIVIDSRIVGIISPDSAPSKRLREEAKERDATYSTRLHVKVRLINRETGEIKEKTINNELQKEEEEYNPFPNN